MTGKLLAQFRLLWHPAPVLTAAQQTRLGLLKAKLSASSRACLDSDRIVVVDVETSGLSLTPPPGIYALVVFSLPRTRAPLERSTSFVQRVRVKWRYFGLTTASRLR